MDFIKFVKRKKHAKKKESSDEEDNREDILLGKKHENEPFNNIKPNKIQKDDEKSSLYEYLTKNKGKIVNEKIIKKPKNKIKKDYSSEDEKEKKLSSEEDYESESDDYAEEKLNHYIGNKFKDDDENEMKETLNEIKRKIKRENINKEEYEKEKEEEEEKEEKEEEEEEENNEEEEKKEKKKKKKMMKKTIKKNK